MEMAYTMIGVDGLQYGPITLEQLKSWVVEGRVTGDTKILRGDTKSWLPAANYSELGLAQTAAIEVADPVIIAPFTNNPKKANYIRLLRRVHSGGQWFYWIAGLSLLNTLLARSGVGIAFGFGLTITRGSDNLALNVAIAGFFALFGVFAVKGHSWSFIVGMILFAVDGAMCLMIQDLLGLAFHAFALFCLFMGLKSNLQLKSSAR
jgi:hypothetical protein